MLASTGRYGYAAATRWRAAASRDWTQPAAGQGRPQRGLRAIDDDPEYMDANAVVAARAAARYADPPFRRGRRLPLSTGVPQAGAAGAAMRLLLGNLATPALASVLAESTWSTALAAWIIVTVTRPLRCAERRGGDGRARRLQHDGRRGRAAGRGHARRVRAPARRLPCAAFAAAPAVGRSWSRLDRFRRESVRALHRDPAQPLTPPPCLPGDAGNPLAGRTGTCRRPPPREWRCATRNAARTVRPLGDPALLDGPEFRLKPMRLDLTEVLDDITLRFAERAAQQGVALDFRPEGGEPLAAEVDVELFECAGQSAGQRAEAHRPAAPSA
ncbi:MAG: hypothetical protein IPF94_13655 [Betaproteobacteria bacterium]|nr:hypothetical protein [Betaproteobacteria bacterium]